MITLKYRNSQNKELVFLGKNNNWQAYDGDIHSRKWQINSTQKIIGDNVQYFSRNECKYKITICLKGTKEERFQMLDEMNETFDIDVMNNQSGKLYFNKYYINCFVIESEISVNKDSNSQTDVDLVIYAPDGMWIKTDRHQFPIQKSVGGDDGLNTPFNFNFNLSEGISAKQIINEGICPSDFKLKIYGPVDEPQIRIGGHDYKVNVSIGIGEYVVINSKNKTLYKYDAIGKGTNIFNLRDKEKGYIFEQIPIGYSNVAWNNRFGFDLEFYNVRSEPKWI